MLRTAGLSGVLALVLSSASPLVALAAEESPIPPALRGRMVAALLGLILVAVLLFVVVRLSMFYVRRRLSEPLKASRYGPNYWAARRFFRRGPPQT